VNIVFANVTPTHLCTLLCSILVPSAVTSLQAVAVNATAINVTWQPPINPNGIVLYRVTVPSLPFSETTINATSLIVNGLDAYTAYCVTVTAYNTAGHSDSLEETVTTQESGNLFGTSDLLLGWLYLITHYTNSRSIFFCCNF